MNLNENIEKVKERIRKAAERSGRKEDDITLIAVTKTHPPDTIDEAIRNGITNVGENRIQEAEDKFSSVVEREKAVWHFIGHLQRNKAKKAVRIFDVIHSVDSESLANELEKHVENTIDVFVEINIGEEEQKSGIMPGDSFRFLETLRKFEKLNCRGLMVIPPIGDTPEDVRKYFRAIADLQNEVNRKNIFNNPLTDLSMGMTDDFETAIEEGATHVRIGRAIFGPRKVYKR
ncbi:YggS family pyridoxal phosphate-dependent enzyme [candidate division KSB1 bacterium]